MRAKELAQGRRVGTALAGRVKTLRYRVAVDAEDSQRHRERRLVGEVQRYVAVADGKQSNPGGGTTVASVGPSSHLASKEWRDRREHVEPAGDDALDFAGDEPLVHRRQRRAERARTDDVGHQVGRCAHRLAVGTAVDAEIAGGGFEQQRHRRFPVEDAALRVGCDPRHRGVAEDKAQVGKLLRRLRGEHHVRPLGFGEARDEALVGGQVAFGRSIEAGFPGQPKHGHIRSPKGELEAAVGDGRVGADLDNA